MPTTKRMLARSLTGSCSRAIAGSLPAVDANREGRGRKVNVRVLSVIGAVQTLSVGSSTSRSQSPSMLIASTVKRMAIPGKVITHQAL
jgi:hypothetical protein